MLQIKLAFCLCFTLFSDVVQGDEYEQRHLEGWTLHVNVRLLKEQPAATRKAIELTHAQLKTIVRVVPTDAVDELRQVPLWFNPAYEGVRPRAEYHPGRKWLVDNGRNPDMERSVEFSNVPIFELETKRMPLFVLHELAHAYHHRVLGHDHAGIKSTFQAAKESGT